MNLVLALFTAVRVLQFPYLSLAHLFLQSAFRPGWLSRQ